jgi:xanthine/uracil permease
MKLTPARSARPGPTDTVDQVLPASQMFLYGLQHALSMYAGVVAVPLVIGTALARQPIVQGTSFAFPEVVAGTVITAIGVSLLPVAIRCNAPSADRVRQIALLRLSRVRHLPGQLSARSCSAVRPVPALTTASKRGSVPT